MLRKLLDEPYQRLITSGCDSRLVADASGLNPYGCDALPRDAVPLGSCSCSSPSWRATQAAQRCLEDLRQSNDPEQDVRRIFATTRQVIRHRFGLLDDTDIAFTPSGTDVELLALALADGGQGREIVNVIVGPAEVGRGTSHAAAGRYYDCLLPSGGTATIGDAVNPGLAERVTVSLIDVRDPSGNVVPPSELDAVITQTVVDAAERGACVLLHLVAHSKTGIHAPRWATVERIARTMKDDVVVVVDAAQGRLGRSTYQHAINIGFLVSVTGSKFFGGPPFAGALLVPSAMSHTVRNLVQLPSGFNQYFSRDEMPESWKSIRDSLDDRCNVGSVLRWTAAMEEINSYYQLSTSIRSEIVNAFENAVLEAFADSKHIEIIESFHRDLDDQPEALLERIPTVFGLKITDSDGSLLSRPRLKQMHSQINQNVGEFFPREDSSALDSKFHLGQPVEIGKDIDVLRIAAGSPLVVSVATDPALGNSFESRIRWLKANSGYYVRRWSF